MKNWQEEQLQALLSINCARGTECERGFFNTLVSEAQRLGFDFFAYGIRIPFPVSRPEIITVNNYPRQWQLIYKNNNYFSIDPTVQHCLRSPLPIIWSDEVFSETRELWEGARSFGLRVGWAQSSRDASGITGMVTLARSGEQLTAAELRDKGLRMSWFAQMAHLGLSKCITSRHPLEPLVQLTQREVAVLRWTADGKTSGEIAEIVGISERTVNFHINNAMEKLGVTNRTAAAVKAAVLGLVY